MPSITCTKIVKEPGGRVRFRFDNGDEIEFASRQDAIEFVRDRLSRETLQALFVRIVLDRQPLLNNIPAVEGKTLNVDTSANNWGTVT